MVEQNNQPTIDLKTYAQRFLGTQAYFARLHAIAQSNHTSNVDKELCINLGMAQAVKEGKLGYYILFEQLLKYNKKEDGSSGFKITAQDANWEKVTKQKHEQKIKAKRLEVQNLNKQGLKDSVRAGFRELAEIYAVDGYFNEASTQFRKSYQSSDAREDQFDICKRTMLYAFETKQDHILEEFSENCRMKDNSKSTSQTLMINILNCLGKFSEPKVMANKFITLQDLNIAQMDELKGIVSQDDLSCYVVLCCLSELSRNELKESVLNNSAILSLLETNADTHNILEDFMLGKFEQFQKRLNVIEAKLKYDAYYGQHLNPRVFKKIRVKTLQQYVRPYKVIDIREIALAFGQPVELIELELSELISSNAIKAKIDSYKKLLHSSKANPQIDMYGNAVNLGEKFIRDTEDMMLKIALIKEDKVLTYKDMGKSQRVGVVSSE